MNKRTTKTHNILIHNRDSWYNCHHFLSTTTIITPMIGESVNLKDTLKYLLSDG